MRLKDQWSGIRKHRRLVAVAFIFSMMAAFSFLSMKNSQQSSAASLANFKPGNIISDAVMGNYNTMSINDIQNFLNSKNQCNNTNYNLWQQLESQYPNLDWHFANGHFVCLAQERFGDGLTVGSGQTAAEIIYYAAQDYKINPRVLLVLLEKEQSLITDTYPNSKQYKSATGYGCPDTAACDSQYYGFKNQVRNAAKLFRTVLDGGWSNYPAGQTLYIQYSPNAACGGTNVYIENRATSALYRYTPYQPNAAALNAGYGTGDSCSAYGNRNFYLLFSDWFGSPQANVKGTQIDLPESEYIFTTQVAGTRALGVANSGTNVQLVEYNQSDNKQRWRVTKTSDGYYTLTHVATNKVLDLSNAETSDNTNLQLYASNGTCAQKWKIYANDGDQLTFESACASGMVVDVKGGASAVGTNVQLYTTNGTNSQKWGLKVGQTLANGAYSMNTAANTKKVIDIAGSGENNGSNIHLWEYVSGENQKWHLKYDSTTDYYTITNVYTGKVLDVSNAEAKRGANIQLYASNNTKAQRWKLVPTKDGNYVLLSACSLGYALDIADGSTANGTNAQLYTYNGTNAQKWKPAVLSPLVKDGTYTLTSRLSSNYVTDISNGNTANGTNIQLWSKNGTVAQAWKITYNANTGDYTIVNPNSNRSIDLANAATGQGANIQLYDQNGSCAQRWYIAAQGDAYKIMSACDRTKVIDVDNAGTYNGVNVQLWTKNGTNAQAWYLKAI